MFCGLGGSSVGARFAGVDVIAAIDMWPLAKATYTDNFPEARFYARNLEYLSARRVLREVGPIDLLLASPECTSHTCARGGRRRSNESLNTAFHVTRFAKMFKPRWIIVENVVQMRSWKRYAEWLSGLQALGYHFREQRLNSADFGVPQARKRLFVTFDSKRVPPEIMPVASAGQRVATEIVDPNGTYRFSQLRAVGRAKATLKRADRAIAQLGRQRAFLLVYYGSDGAGGWQRMDAPLRTVTTIDRFAYVRPADDGHEMRMLQVPELKEAMGLGQHRLEHGTRRDKIKLIGNGVCPPVMKAVIEATTAASDSATCPS